MVDFEALAKAAGWRYSDAHGGWINDSSSYRNGPEWDDYEVHDTAEDVCVICELVPESQAAWEAAMGMRGYAGSAAEREDR